MTYNATLVIGIIYEAQGEYVKSKDFHTRSLLVSEEIGYKYGSSNALNNIGIIYQLQGNHTDAIDYCSRGLKIAEEIGNKNGIAYSLNTIARSYVKQGNYQKSLSLSKRALKTATEIGSILKVRAAAYNLYEAYQHLGDYKASLEMHELYIELRDSIENIDGQKEVIRQELKYNYEKQSIADSIAFANQQALVDLNYQSKLEKQRYAFFIGISLLLIFLGVYLRIRFIKSQAQLDALLQEIKLLKVQANINLGTITPTEEAQLDKERIEKALKTTLNPSDWNILNALYTNPAIGNKEIADVVSLSIEGVRSSLKKMYRYFYIEKTANQRVLLVIQATKLSNPSLGK